MVFQRDKCSPASLFIKKGKLHLGMGYRYNYKILDPETARAKVECVVFSSPISYTMKHNSGLLFIGLLYRDYHCLTGSGFMPLTAKKLAFTVLMNMLIRQWNAVHNFQTLVKRKSNNSCALIKEQEILLKYHFTLKIEGKQTYNTNRGVWTN